MRMHKTLAELGLTAYATAVIAFLLIPVAIVVPMSLTDSLVFEVVPSRLSLSQYFRLFSNAAWMEVLGRSIQVATAVMFAATALGTLAAMGIMRLTGAPGAFAEALFIAPQIVPSVVIAVSSYYVFSRSGLVGTTLGIVIAHTLIALPFVVVLVRSRLQSLDPDLTLASASLGASPAQTFFRITVPQLRITLFGAGILAFHVSFDEVVLALFLTGARNKTLPVKLWDSILFEVTPILPAISTVVIAIPILFVAAIAVLRRWARQ
jgi:putative spermidine/putrescine transport system permease protein